MVYSILCADQKIFVEIFFPLNVMTVKPENRGRFSFLLIAKSSMEDGVCRTKCPRGENHFNLFLFKWTTVKPETKRSLMFNYNFPPDILKLL